MLEKRRSWIGAGLVAALLLAISPARAAPTVRIKDLTRVEGVRSNPLIGYGLVVGLDGTGDGTQARFTTQSLSNMLRRSGIALPRGGVRVKNIAAVMVTADLPPFAKPSQRLTVWVASIGDAKSLEGGMLLMTPLLGPDGKTYAVAQGPVSLGGGFTAGSGGDTVSKNHPTAGTISGGASVERRVPLALDGFDRFRLLLEQPDFATATRIADAVNARFNSNLARAEDAATVSIVVPPDRFHDRVGLLADVESVTVRPDTNARVVINERTGTVVMGEEVRISTVALAHGNLTIEVHTEWDASQPAPFAERGRTVVVPQQETYVSEDPATIATLEEGISVSDLVQALNSLGVSARDMVAIFQAMHAAGALHAELVVL